MELNFSIDKKDAIIALGAESTGNFCVYDKGKIYFSEDFGDLLDEKNWENYKKIVLKYLKDNKIKPQIILTDLHPSFYTTLWGKQLAQKYKAKHIPIQHHHAHIFSAIGDKIIQNTKYQLPDTIYGIACDGTGYGLDGKIWGGEIFQVKSSKLKVKSISRMGHLENQTLIGGDLAVKEPARMLISILDKVFSASSSPVIGRRCPVLRTVEGTSEREKKKKIYNIVKKHYSHNEFELLHNQLQQKFNCLETSSAGRILDAASLLLGFCRNSRNYKHEPIDLLEKNSTKPYADLKPKITSIKFADSSLENSKFEIDSKFNPAKRDQNSKFILDTTDLFKYLIRNLHKDKKRLAATAQLYLAEGIYEILQNIQNTKYKIQNTFFAGGIANNKIISDYLTSKGIYVSKKIHPVKFERSETGKAVFNGVPRGDAGLSFGQVLYYLLS